LKAFGNRAPVLVLFLLASCSSKSSSSDSTDTPDNTTTGTGSGGGTTGGTGGDMTTGTGTGTGTGMGPGADGSVGTGTGGSDVLPPVGDAGVSIMLGPVPTTACPKLKLEPNVQVAKMATDRFTFSDAACLPRTAAMAQDHRGFLRQYTYTYDSGKVRTATGTGVNGWDGWGFIINHGLEGGGANSSSAPTIVFTGDHHAIYEYKSTVNGVVVTRRWFFASGRDNPLFAVTFDATARQPGINADTRTPYGDIAWDGDEYFPNTVVSGVGWGDRYKFITTKAPLTLNSTWDYTQRNLIPYVLEWADKADAEMGAVQTQTYLQKDAGGYWWYPNWGKTSANQMMAPNTTTVGLMPISWDWTYQLNQYELCFSPQSDACADMPTNSHRLCWGTNYGAVGGANAKGTYPAYGDDKQLVGYPYQSYAVFMVLGKHSDKKVFQQVAEIEAVQRTKLTATTGTVVTELPGGVGRTDMVTLSPPGWDPRYATWNVAADGNKAAFSVNVASGAIVDPVIVISNFTGTTVPTVTVDGMMGTPDVTYLASLDTANHLLWITLRPGWQGTQQISIQ
jgi:hypothetical protein